MVFCKAPLSSLASAIFFAYAQASYLQNDLSFGHTNDKISPNLRAIPNWHLLGKPDPPEILSNKVVLTPPAPGNQRGAIWSEKVVEHSSWTADIDFRATGPERGGGNLQIWYAKNGQNEIGTSSIYTVGRFDGLVLSIDQYAGSGGFIRGFLNDGSNDYQSHHSVDSLAFGHCEYSYRNLGRPSRIAVRHSDEGLRVQVDGINCFESTRIKLPLGYNFGITAASAENPDSFEMFKFVTTTETHTPDYVDQSKLGQIPENADANKAWDQQTNQVQDNQNQNQNQGGDIPSFKDPPEEPASKFHSSAEQFADLHNRLQSMNKHIGALSRDQSMYSQQANSRYDDLNSRISRIEAAIDKLRGLSDKLDTIHSDVRQTKSDLHNALDKHVAGLRGEVRNTHSVLAGTLEGMGTGVGKFVWVVLGSQVLLIGAYLLYKRRKANSPKKYL
ncbi:concanavalin A-like lectin/glucanase [Mollisia scopiformis]|uniref:Concanavalin A-like lectin/glucanase n=1 Tax=Mollisia scopiformis TaxID=149040 RepID=A0A194XH70_MOLSC|nr:concanavalin A-like lectin/glucanase [Mollisia scopiformis]KUJ19555.1 concanavalin A-like lectin/glucanase [Mollisia scopiformis]